MGEHGEIGAIDDQLYGELLNVPLLIRSPDRREALRRNSALVQPADLHHTLQQWLTGEQDDQRIC